MNIRYAVYLLSCLCLLSCSPGEEIDSTTPEWISLFNGKDLDDWNIKIRGSELGENFNNTFVVEDSLLKVKYNEYDSFDTKFGHIFYKEEYSWYRLVVEYRFVGEQVPGGPGWAVRNNGAMLHGQPAETMSLDQDFPISIEVQLLGGNGKDERTTSNLCTPGTNVVYDGKLDTRHCITSTSKTYHGDQWVEADILVLGDSLIEHYLEGELVLSYEDPQMGGGSANDLIDGIMQDGKLLESGTISFQSESHPTEFRRIELLNLKGCMDPKAKNFKSYYLKDDPGSCMY